MPLLIGLVLTNIQWKLFKEGIQQLFVWNILITQNVKLKHTGLVLLPYLLKCLLYYVGTKTLSTSGVETVGNHFL
jgi:hypothetical protein